MDAPYMVRVQYATIGGVGGQGGGSIISHQHVLTSAFVITPDFPNLNVFLGATTRQSQQQVTVQQRTIHPQYQGNPRINDIGVITLNLALIFNRFVQPIALPAVTAFLPRENEQGTALGFGGSLGNLNPSKL